ncbi:DUF3482 domain-containing protein [Lampropedia cohaerens]|uniref:DUF3482 domain-containing protein n=1 Tax=Lampropedia cohaerens TaxID=1610491 RepID=UPI000A07CC80|nr:DUF3482 domain-containing protein [Lampropedia cohaerens]
MSTPAPTAPAHVLTPAAHGTQVQWCLISHTNIGKTTLTRTLLGQDVGDIRDAPHVTDSADAHVMLQTPEGDRLTLWDTPGFGDSVRLYQRLRQHNNPMGWFLSNLWDRWRDKPFWMSQRAMQAARSNADVVLYLVNAAEDPADAGYLDAEMHLLRWLDKPVIVLLNQIGAPDARKEAQDLQTWTQAMAAYAPMVRKVVALDAFTRSWLHEQRLFQAVASAIPPDKQAGYARIMREWERANHARLDASMRAIAELLAHAARWKEPVAEPGAALSWRLLTQAIQQGKADSRDSPEDKAMQALLAHLREVDQQTTQTLLRLHHLDGSTEAEIHAQLREYFTVHTPLDTRQMGLLGALTTGAAGGLGADLAAGGLTMGAGALLGALAGAVTFAGAALGINRARAQTQHQVELSDAFLDALLHASLLKYLAIAHFGRGRGSYTQTQAPAHWNEALNTQIASLGNAHFHALWHQLRQTSADGGADAPANSPALSLQASLRQVTLATLHALYPDSDTPSTPMPSDPNHCGFSPAAPQAHRDRR